MQAFSLGEESNKTHTILFPFVDIKIQNNFFCVLFACEYEYFGEFLKKYRNTKKFHNLLRLESSCWNNNFSIINLLRTVSDIWVSADYKVGC